MRAVTIFLIIVILLCSGCYNDLSPTYYPTSYHHSNYSDYTVNTRQFSCDDCYYIFRTSEFAQCLECAEAGNASAAYGIAGAYEDGSVGEKDLSTAFKWYKTSADLGYKRAFRTVFDSYYFGKLSPENKELAQLYLEKASNVKCEWAMLLLAKWSEDNESEKAIELYSQANAYLAEVVLLFEFVDDFTK
ncbi:hypothetical protein MUP37_04825, partial [Candidatus Bathyarchaeota archaeon]|nr:hypothetical protein [Candidatus Bathyarchaeota archaeon]